MFTRTALGTKEAPLERSRPSDGRYAFIRWEKASLSGEDSLASNKAGAFLL